VPGRSAACRDERTSGYDHPVSRLARFAWIVLLYNVAVILWGAYVRATGSGAGCGSHWPLCNGVVLPRAPEAATLIEFSHRLSSGLALVAVVVLLIWVRRACPAGHPARTGAALSVFFMLTEAGVGAGLVLFRLVADNASMARALFMVVHLMNTFVLLAVLALTAWWLSGAARLRLAGRRTLTAGALAGAVAILLVSASGAVAALGDTLFPAASLFEALRADLSATSHLLIRLRVLHPVLAVSLVIGLLSGAPRLARRSDGTTRQLSRTVMTVAALQLVMGSLNIVLLAPVWLQLVHLLLADALWIAFVLLAAAALAAPDVAIERARWPPSEPSGVLVAPAAADTRGSGRPAHG
jgi:heme A synthase